LLRHKTGNEMKEHIFLSGISIEEFEADLLEKLKALIQPALIAIQREEAEDFLTRKQVAKLLGVSLVTISKWQKNGNIKFHRFGTRIRFKRSEILNAEKYRRTK
jgi:excisionase family DNA binding protein